MPHIRYIDKKIGAKKLDLIERAAAICTEYEAQGFILTLRQLYYQFVARGLIENTFRSYKQLGDAVSDGRLVGMIDWNHITDRTRQLRALDNWESPEEIVHNAAGWYHRDLWAGQERRVEVWIEKDALVGVIESVCEENDVPFFSCRGYPSQSEIWRAAQRHRARGVPTTVIHLGDHDPSGIDMTRDIRDRLRGFGALDSETERIALNMDQIDQYAPPPNPTKFTDSRAPDYVARYGNDSWELDALEPAVLVELIDKQIRLHRDADVWQAQVARQEYERAELIGAADRWSDVQQHLEES